MNLGLLGQAAGMFAVTNIDDMLVLALFFGHAGHHRPAVTRVVLGQYLGFSAILLASVAGALGAGLLPEAAIPYLGVAPLLSGVGAGWQVWHERRSGDIDHDIDRQQQGPRVWQVAAVMLANGGDNIGVYVPVFATVGVTGTAGYLAVFLIGVALWCAIGWFLATRPVIARALAHWGHLIMPAVLIGIGSLILVEGGRAGAGPAR